MIPLLFVRNEFKLTKQVTPGCEWVARGKGTASRMWDGLPCLVRAGYIYKLAELAAGAKRPPGAIPNGSSVWVPADADSEADKPYVDTYVRLAATGTIEDGPHELCGPGIAGNNDKLRELTLLRHGQEIVQVGRSFDSIRDYLSEHPIKGIVFALPDGRAAKIRRTDFGLAWGNVTARAERRMRGRR